MYTILPVYQEKMPESFIFDNINDAVEGAVKDFNDPSTPETKGFMIVKIEKAMGIDRSLQDESPIDLFIMKEPYKPNLDPV